MIEPDLLRELERDDVADLEEIVAPAVSTDVETDTAPSPPRRRGRPPGRTGRPNALRIAVWAALRRNPSRSDDVIAAEAGASPSLVARMRVSLGMSPGPRRRWQAPPPSPLLPDRFGR